MKTRFAAIAVTIASWWTIGCTAQARSPKPVPVDRAECARCRMLISSDRGGGEIVSSSEETRFYDDIGCLSADWVTHGQNASAFVRLPSGKWSEAHAASYAQPNGVETPMGSGFAAFATIADARAADRSGRVFTFDDVVTVMGAKR